MINLDIENLNDVNLILERLDAHDRFIEAKIELFEEIDKTKGINSSCSNHTTCTTNNSSANYYNGSGVTAVCREEDTHKECLSTNGITVITTIPVDSSTFSCDDKGKNVKKKSIPEIINTKEKKSILANIINILNYIFPDYEFKHLNNSNYKYIRNINSVIDTINYNLFYIIEKIYRGFNKRIWKILKELIDFKSCDVYTYLNSTDNDPYVDKESISSFNYFFFAKKNKRILFISCITKPKYKNQNDEDFNNVFIGIQDEPSVNDKNECDDEDSSIC
ncbi:repressor of RNA polymerase III transcription MAF1 [Plasmodium brasilianum]|uniref:Repressor of RNA polymerase III transcription n=2 Tax=Plasmodium (Plasmodium) TaxID=418103 RepID=A0A1A8VUL1_PLAMA|nr:repressor of RNA polymerase III transcription MAF1, putative [Plasmodium malariae]KAI4840115.1 repressor of RNA polymerase III transcription MAF1 [Plasmodium brasilianum]SBS83040.1 repressor of RNA polymerase III transcription MAF1, putative [Plasmodium malariae]SBT87478.1 repressor of RNA polymerase III transcription MAF1, putative [Plasmodium malariae]